MDWQGFFESYFYWKAWVFRIDPERTAKEVEGVLELLKPKSGSHFLDWAGGWGRHTIELAKRGYQVTLLDFAANHIEMARRLAEEAGVKVNFVHSDFRQTPASIQADYAINLFTSAVGYLTEDDDLQAFRSLHAALKPGALFLIDTMNLFWLVKNYQPRGWHESEDGKRRLLSERKFDYMTNRNISREVYTEAGGEEEEHRLDLHIYSAAELATILRRAGFEPVELYGDFNGESFDFDSKRIVMISERR